MKGILLAVCLAGVAPPAMAGVKSAAPQGFEVTQTFQTTVAPAALYAALLQPGRWWNSDHTYSGKAANMSLDAHAGGCFCETLPNGGGVEHMRVVNIAPGRFLRLSGALGPLADEGVVGSWTISIEPAAGGSILVGSYVVGGYFRPTDGKTSTAEVLAPAVDGVLADQMQRLKRYVEAGAPM